MLVSIISMFALAAAAPLLLLTYTVDPSVGGDYITLAFVITLMGSAGNIFGALIGGMIIGLSDVYITIFFGSWVTGFSKYLIFVIVLLILPYLSRWRSA
jgi:branched-chain amino acid transport system permease protein